MIDEKRIAIKCVTGSHATGLNDDKSDIDRKIVFYPTIDELFSGRHANKQTIMPEEDTEYVDIRSFMKSLQDTTINGLEILFGADINVVDENISPILTNKNNIAKCNLPKLFLSTSGMAYNQYNSFTSLKRPNNAKSVLFFDRHSQDTKSLMTIVRLCKTLELFAESEFTDFQSSFCFKDDEIGKRYMLNVKNNVGNLTFEENVEFAKIYMARIDMLRDEYMKHSIDLDTNGFVSEVIHNATLINMIKNK